MGPKVVFTKFVHVQNAIIFLENIYFCNNNFTINKSIDKDTSERLFRGSNNDDCVTFYRNNEGDEDIQSVALTLRSIWRYYLHFEIIWVLKFLPNGQDILLYQFQIQLISLLKCLLLIWFWMFITWWTMIFGIHLLRCNQLISALN